MPDRVRILMMVSGLAIGEPLGGAERFGLELACHLDSERFEPIVCAFWRRGVPSERHWADYLSNAGVGAFFAANWRGGADLPGYVVGLRSIASHFQDRPVDVIHSHFQVGSMAALFLKRTLHARAVMRTAHAGKEWGETALGFLFRQVFTKWIFPAVFDAEVGVSRTMVCSLDRRPGARITGKKALLLYNGISLDRFARASGGQHMRRELGLCTNNVVVGSVGRLRREKGYSILLDSAAIVRSQSPNVKFVIIGDGELWHALHQQAKRLSLSQTVIFAGARQDVESLFGMMDLFVLPSLWEGLPTVVLESMASGVPVVATDIPGTRELIQAGQTGWLARPGDPVSLAACILEALSDPAKRAAVARTASQDVVPRFSMAYIADQYEKAYLQLTKT